MDRIAFAIVNVIKRYDKPAVLILEDLQWAIESLEPLRHFMRSIDSSHWLVIGTYRNDEKPDLPNEIAGIHTISLPRLEMDAVQELSVSILGSAGTNSDLLNLLQRETEGNAFFIVEVVNALAEQAGNLNRIEQLHLPERIITGGIRAAIQRRVESLPRWGRILLDHVAIAGRELDSQLTEMLATQKLQDSRSFDEWLNTCAERGILTIEEQMWRFSHDKIRETVIDSIDQSDLPDYHRNVAIAIESVYEGHTNDHSESLLSHWQNASDAEKILQYIPPVVEQVKMRGQYDLAEILINQGMALLPKISDESRQQVQINFTEPERRIRLFSWQIRGCYSTLQASRKACKADQ